MGWQSRGRYPGLAPSPQPSPPCRPTVIAVPQILLLEIHLQLNRKAQDAARRERWCYTTSLAGLPAAATQAWSQPPAPRGTALRGSGSIPSSILAGRLEEGQGGAEGPSSLHVG